MSRQIILDTETTGLSPSQDHRIIEIGCIEMVDRIITDNVYHQYIDPERKVEKGAFEVHGLGNEFLATKPNFKAIADDFLAFIDGAELIIHNAPFDVGFINHEFKKIKGFLPVEKYCAVFDTLTLARKLHPGKKNTLDALCSRYSVDNSSRDLHGALLDSQILAQVYLLMTGGQESLFADTAADTSTPTADTEKSVIDSDGIIVLQATEHEAKAHQAYVDSLGPNSLWKQLDI